MIKWSKYIKNPETFDIDKLYWITYFFLLFGVMAFTSMYIMFELALLYKGGNLGMFSLSVYFIIFSMPFGFMSWLYEKKADKEGWS